MKRVLITGFTALLLPMVAACTSGTSTKPSDGAASGSAATQQLSVKAMDTMKFDPPTLTARAGQPIQVTLENTGQLVHDFSISEGVSPPVASVAQPGQKTVSTFTVDKPGTYTYFCSQPGHEQAGMKGTLTVQ
jgi:plastocyanin